MLHQLGFSDCLCCSGIRHDIGVGIDVRVSVGGINISDATVGGGSTVTNTGISGALCKKYIVTIVNFGTSDRLLKKPLLKVAVLALQTQNLPSQCLHLCRLIRALSEGTWTRSSTGLVRTRTRNSAC